MVELINEAKIQTPKDLLQGKKLGQMSKQELLNFAEEVENAYYNTINKYGRSHKLSIQLNDLIRDVKRLSIQAKN